MATDDLQQVQKQTVTLSLQLRKALKILQVPAMELRSAILEELQQNPVLEELPLPELSLSENAQGNDSQEAEDPQDGELNFEDNFTGLEYLDDENDFHKEHVTHTAQAEERRQYFFNSLVSEPSLQEHLIQQAQQSDLSATELKAIPYLIGSLDDRGFLTNDYAAIAQLAQLSVEAVERAGYLLKTLDPPGIGAANVQECLLSQLQLQGKGDSLAARILRDHYELLLRRRLPELAQNLSEDPHAIQKAVETIAALDPAPGRKFSTDHNRIIVPDVSVKKVDGQWRVVLNNDYIPRLRISSHYKHLLAKEDLSSKEKAYIREKIKAGHSLIDSIAQRQQTLERIAEYLLGAQKGFFEEGLSKLRPLKMLQVAEALKVHETTISRAIADKYIETPWGVVAFKYFFTSGFKRNSGEAVSRTSVKDTIARLIENEDPFHPLADQDIVAHLAQKAIKVARRTVAKYREELGILPTYLRRQYKP